MNKSTRSTATIPIKKPITKPTIPRVRSVEDCSAKDTVTLLSCMWNGRGTWRRNIRVFASRVLPCFLSLSRLYRALTLSVFNALLFFWKTLRGHAIEPFALINHLHPDISLQILHTALYPFYKVLTWRICSIMKSFFIWWAFPLYLWWYCLIQGWYCQEQTDTSDSKG